MSSGSVQRRKVLKVAALALGAGAAGMGTSVLAPRVWAAAQSPDRLARLDRMQAGHLRHLLNLAAQPDGDWSHMMTGEVEQHGLASWRYQLGHFVYALGLAHYHHLPAAPGLFREPMQRLITKMLRQDVWRYWYEESRSSPRFDPGITQPREPWADPVAKENIMYSGHLHAMAGLYEVLFNEDRYEQPGSLSMQHERMWEGRESFDYDLGSLNAVIYQQMRDSGWLGIPCEPNMVFIICNQLPLLGLRFHDLRKGTSLAPETTANFREAWQKKGILGEGGKSITFMQVRQGRLIPSDPGVDAHTGTFMNAWNPDSVQKYFPPRIREGLRRAPDGSASPFPHSVLAKVAEARARGENVNAIEDRNYRWTNPDLGTMATFFSEMGDAESLQALQSHVDQYMQPTWEKGGLFYPRNDRNYDTGGNLTWMDPLTGNGLVQYASLNVQNGMAAMYNEPWTAAHFRAPAVQKVSDGVDLLRAGWQDDRRTLVVTAQAATGAVDAAMVVSGLDAGRGWTVRRDGQVYASSRAPEAARAIMDPGAGLVIRGQIGRETDFVISQA